MKIVAMIPARKGSKRLKNKNLSLISGKPLIYYSIKTAKESKIFSEIYINSDDEIYKKIAERYKVNFYKRPLKLGGSKIKSDDVVLDFIKKIKSDILVWVNPIAPLQTSQEISKIVNYFKKNNLNSLITSRENQVHFSYKKKPVNFSLRGKFEQTQNLVPLEEMVYSIMMWSTNSFIKSMSLKGNAIMHGKFDSYNVSKLSSLIVKKIEDVWIIESILNQRKKIKNKIKYDNIISSNNRNLRIK